ncbi:hypothetical protein AMECASPLE_025758, partial [Ameca splendens]
GIGPTFDGEPKLIQEREQPKTQPDTKDRNTQSQSHIPTLMHTHKNTHAHTPNVKTNNNRHRTRTHTPHTYSILPGPGADNPKSHIGGRPPQHAKDRAPRQPHTHTGHPPSHTAHLDTPSRMVNPSTKA